MGPGDGGTLVVPGAAAGDIQASLKLPPTIRQSTFRSLLCLLPSLSPSAPSRGAHCPAGLNWEVADGAEGRAGCRGSGGGWDSLPLSWSLGPGVHPGLWPAGSGDEGALRGSHRGPGERGQAGPGRGTRGDVTVLVTVTLGRLSYHRGFQVSCLSFVGDDCVPSKVVVGNNVCELPGARPLPVNAAPPRTVCSSCPDT